jgi:enoyl-[acyl-carrier-protein] reductase (NADH)
VLFNRNAADEEALTLTLDEAQALLQSEGGQIELLLHSLAFGTLQPLAWPPERQLRQNQLQMTMEVMAHSLVWWSRGIVQRGLMGRGGRIFAMTSAGSRSVLPSYGAVSAAKAALESHVRQLAVELAPLGVTANAILAGVTDTPALRRIPGHEALIARALAGNPHGRLTTPEDVAAALVELARPGLYWLTGNVLQIDGGEAIVG